MPKAATEMIKPFGKAISFIKPVAPAVAFAARVNLTMVPSGCVQTSSSLLDTSDWRSSVIGTYEYVGATFLKSSTGLPFTYAWKSADPVGEESRSTYGMGFPLTEESLT